MAAFPTDPKERQKVLLGILAVGGLAYAGYAYGYEPRRAELETLETRAETLETRNRAARIQTRDAAGGELERTLERQQAQLTVIEGLIPSSEELPDLLDAISTEARNTGVDLSLIQPVSASDEEFYTRRVYDLGVLGPYHAVGEFLTRIASLPRVITPINLSLVPQGEATPLGEQRLEARFSIETYIVPPPQASTEEASED